MRRHQILTGAVNPGNHCFSIGSIASFTFWAYGSGCDLVILGVDLQPIHVIPGHVRGYKLISCVDCCQFCGKIAVSYGYTIVIYHPKLINSENDGVPVFTWVEESTLQLEKFKGPATVLSWASSGEKLLVGCREILLWGAQKSSALQEFKKRTNLKVHFSIDEVLEETDETDDLEEDKAEEPHVIKKAEWKLLWRSGMEENLRVLQFSPDDELFASVSRDDTMIKVWHQRSLLPLGLFGDTLTVDAAARPKHSSSYTHTMSNTSCISNQDRYHTAPPNLREIDFTFTYLIHPKPVVGFSWRKGVPLLPNGTVPNVLISSCRDNMCRVWCETLTPPVDVTKLATAHTTVHSGHVKGGRRHSSVDKGATVKKSISAPVMHHENEKTPDYKNFDKPATRLFRHFHIAATINPTSDIPLLPSISAMDSYSDAQDDETDEDRSMVFTVHWLDNKHHHAMAHLNQILHETMSETKVLNDDTGKQTEDHDTDTDSLASNHGIPLTSIKSPPKSPSPIKRPSNFTAKFPVWDSSKPESVDAYLSCLASPASPEIQSDLGLSLPNNVYDLLRRAWLDQSDALFAIHPTDGSLLVWHISYLDENRCGQIRQAQVSFSSRIPMAIPACDASTLCSRLVLYANHYSAHLAFNATQSPQKNQESEDIAPPEQDAPTSPNGLPSPTVSLLSKHSDGSLNQWEIAFSAITGYSTVTSITHKSRFCGHRYHLSGIFCHPTLPLLLTTSHHQHSQENVSKINPLADEVAGPRKWASKVRSELILWRVDPVGTLCHAGGVTELSRMNGPSKEDFTKVTWFPVLFPSWCLGASNTSPSTSFLSMHGSSLKIYQVVIDAEHLLDDVDLSTGGNVSQEKLGHIASQQSSSQPGCLLLLDTIQLDEDVHNSEREILLLSVYPEEQFSSPENETKQKGQDQTHRSRGLSETFFVVLMEKSMPLDGARESKVTVRMWKISFSAHLSSVTGTRTRRSTSRRMSDSSENPSDEEYNAEDLIEDPSQRLSYLDVTSTCLASQTLIHPSDVNVIMASATSDPFSLCVFHHIQILPFSLLTTCEDGQAYFWRGTRSNENHLGQVKETIQWVPWNSNVASNAPVPKLSQPHIGFEGKPLVVKMAHCCMLACLSEVDSGQQSLCYVSIYECISSGGSLWRLQDRILAGTIDHVSSVGQSAHLDWLSREDGTFLLTVNVGRKVRMYTQSPVGMQWEEMAKVQKDDTARVDRPLLKRQSTLDVVTRQKLMGPHMTTSQNILGTGAAKHSQCDQDCNHLLHWSLLSEISIGNSLGLSAVHLDNLVTPKPQPVMVSWVRDGLLLVATETEMHVFCHWMEQHENGNSQNVPANSGVLYGSASLSHSTPEGLCQYVMQEPGMLGNSQMTSGGPVVSLMSVADVLCPCLPQYHPLVLSELTNGGHVDTVKHILINLARMMNGQLESKDSIIQVEPLTLGKFGLAMEDDENEQKRQIAPLLLHELLDEDGHINDKITNILSSSESKKRNSQVNSNMEVKAPEKTNYEDLFSTSASDQEDDGFDFTAGGPQTAHTPDTIDLSEFDPGYLGPEHCQVMHSYLSRNLLPGLSSLDQMELMAIADTVASDQKVAGGTGNTATESMDQCGLRFVFAMHNHLCLLRSLPAQQRAKLLRQGLGSCNFAWAFHSDAEEEMLSLISSVQRGAPEWQELRSFGAGWWIRSTATLRRLVEQTARTAFQKDNNPLDAAIFYMALNKKNVLKGLFKSVHDDRMMQFFAQDFSEERWHRAALKNAFALMGKQRFQEAAAFFLLANSVQDAIEVCIDKMQDLQLASIIVRLYDQENSAASHTEFLQRHVLGVTKDDGNGKEIKIHPDPFIRSMAHWALGSYENALKTLLENHRTEDDSILQLPASITDIFNFYNYLRTHPLIMRQKKIDQSQDVGSAEKQVDDRITLEERMLFFATAASHLDAGCPLLTLDVLSSLPPLRQEEQEENQIPELEEENSDSSFQESPPTLQNIDGQDTASSLFTSETEWGVTTPVEQSEENELDLNWSESEEEESSESEIKEETRPTMKITAPTPVKAEKQNKPTGKSETPKKSKVLSSDIYAHQLRLMACLKIFVSELKSLASTYHSDGGQLREQLYCWLERETEVLHRISPIAEVKPLIARTPDSEIHGNNGMEDEQKSEFSSGSESDGEPRRRYRLTGDDTSMSPAGGILLTTPSLHELYLAEKQDWKYRREIASHRRRWLRQYRRFLRTLLSYCCLHDDVQGTLSPLRMELLLLLQDSLQERTPQQLSSPLPNPTSIPLLSSSVVACRTVVAEPTSRLTHMAQDILSTLLMLPEPPPYPSSSQSVSPTIALCRQAEALSSCIYQSLCDTNSRSYRARLLDGERVATPDTHVVPGSLPSSSTLDNQYVPPSTQPSQWPGVVSLQALLNSDTGDNRPRLIVLLCESLVAVYVSLLVHGLHTSNSLLLYRLVSHSLCEKTWNAVFGGGARVTVKYSKPVIEFNGKLVSGKGLSALEEEDRSPMRTDGSKGRDKLNRRVLSYSLERRGSFTSANSADQTSYREKFVAPETTLWDCLLSKPLITFSGSDEVGFDSDGGFETDSSTNNYSDDSSLDEFGEIKEESENKATEHGDPASYSWHILRLAVVRTVLHNLKVFLPSAGLELSELGTSSPMLNSVLQLLGQWQLTLANALESFPSPPIDFIQGIQGVGQSLRGRPAILKYQAMLDPNNTPFSGSSVGSLGARRLWHCLVRRENLQEMFIRYIFQKKQSDEKNDLTEVDRRSSVAVGVLSPSNQAIAALKKKPNGTPKSLQSRRATIAVMSLNEGGILQQNRPSLLKNKLGINDGRVGKVKILHKETEIISSFCINNANPNCVVLSTNRDIQEIDVSNLLSSDTWSWVEEDISPTVLQHEEVPKTSSHKEEDFLVVTRRQSAFVGAPSLQSTVPNTVPWASASQTGQGANVLLKRSFSGVRRMTSHPSLPYYLTGHHDGSIRMWEWGHQQQISLFRAAGQFPKVTNLHFSLLGNKISASDADGYMALWQVSSPKKPFLFHQCHDRTASDCCFMSSSSVLATTGLSSTNRNVAIWDTLLPSRSMLVKDFLAHEGLGASCVAYAAQKRTLVVGGRDGKVSVFDLRRPDEHLHCFSAHESPVKCIDISSDERSFVTGSVVGDVRVWDTQSHLLAYNLSGEHARTSIFRNFGSGTMKVEIGDPGNKVFSCGADGTLKLRVLPHDNQNDIGGRSLGGRIQKLSLQRQVVKLADAIRQQCLVY